MLSSRAIDLVVSETLFRLVSRICDGIEVQAVCKVYDIKRFSDVPLTCVRGSVEM